jgi:tRNA dimethylallyltransferase
LDIGTGKITKREMKGVRHHLLDVASPKKVFTAADYVRLARKAYSSVLQNTGLAIITGGTGFYIDALLGRVSLGEVPANKTLRNKLHGKSADELYAMLSKKDAARARKMNESDRQNPVRLIRALEISARPRRIVQQGDALLTNANIIWAGIAPDKTELREKIYARLRARMKAGMVAEARKLHADGLSWKRMEELWLEYRYLALYLQKQISKDEMLRQLEAKIWQYAKRQMTYWRRNKEIRWFKSPEEALDFVSSGR